MNEALGKIFKDFHKTMLLGLHDNRCDYENMPEYEVYEKLNKDLEALGLNKFKMTEINGRCSCTIETLIDEQVYAEQCSKIDQDIEPLTKQIKELEQQKIQKVEEQSRLQKTITETGYQSANYWSSVRQTNTISNEIKKLTSEQAKKLNEKGPVMKLYDMTQKEFIRHLFSMIKHIKKPDGIANDFSFAIYTKNKMNKWFNSKASYEELINNLTQIDFEHGELELSSTKKNNVNEARKYITEVFQLLPFGFKIIESDVIEIVYNIIDDIQNAKTLSDIKDYESLKDIKFTLNACSNYERFPEFIHKHNSVRLSFCEFVMLENIKHGLDIVTEYVKQILKINMNAKQINISMQALGEFFEANPLCAHILGSKKTPKELTFIDLMFRYNVDTVWFNRVSADEIIENIPEVLFADASDDNEHSFDVSRYIIELNSQKKHEEIKSVFKYFASIIQKDYNIMQFNSKDIKNHTIKHKNLYVIMKFLKLEAALEDRIVSICDQTARTNCRSFKPKNDKNTAQVARYQKMLKEKYDKIYDRDYSWFNSIWTMLDNKQYGLSANELNVIKNTDINNPVVVINSDYYPCTNEEKEFFEQAIKHYQQLDNEYVKAMKSKNEEHVQARNDFVTNKLNELKATEFYSKVREESKSLVNKYYATKYQIEFEDTKFKEKYDAYADLKNKYIKETDPKKKSVIMKKMKNILMVHDTYCLATTSQEYLYKETMYLIPFYRIELSTYW